MEVWAVGDLPVKDDEDGGGEGQVGMPYMLRESMLIVLYFPIQKRSILDGNLEDRAMLEIAGKQMHSDGLREPGMDD